MGGGAGIPGMGSGGGKSPTGGIGAGIGTPVAGAMGGGGGRFAEPGMGGGGRVGLSSSSDMLRTTVTSLTLHLPLTYAALVLPHQRSWC